MQLKPGSGSRRWENSARILKIGVLNVALRHKRTGGNLAGGTALSIGLGRAFSKG